MTTPKYPEKVLTEPYFVSPITTYDHDDLLYYTKIGQNNPEMSLFCIAAGKTLTISRERAINLAKLLNEMSKNK